MSLAIDNLTVNYGARQILQNLSIDRLPKGELTVLIGPNAAGKSTLFKAIAGLIKSKSGSIYYDNVELGVLDNRQRLKKVCYMPQQFADQSALTVFEVILLAKKLGQNWHVTQEDITAIERQLHTLNINYLAHRHIAELSGGQQQLVSLAQVLIREADIYLLDEPTSALDLQHQLTVLHRIKKEAIDKNITAIVSLHDLNLAARFADYMVLMSQGKVIKCGDVTQVFESGLIESTYSVQLEFGKCSSGKYIIAAK